MAMEYVPRMLHIFLSNYRQALIDRCLLKVAQRSHPESDQTFTHYGVPIILDQLIHTLEVEKSENPLSSLSISGPAGGPSHNSELGQAATKHGRELSDRGCTIEQVVHDYGDLCQAITELAFELNEKILSDEFRTLNRCLDNAIADAVTEFSHQRRMIRDDREEQTLKRQLSIVVHELRDHLILATHAISVLKAGRAGFGGATAAVLDRSLTGMRNIVDISVANVRLTGSRHQNHELFSLKDFIDDVKESASFEALASKCEFSVSIVHTELAVEADRGLLFSAVTNLLQNAFKFTVRGTKVSLTAYADDDQVRIDVQDHCGGLGPGNKEDLFVPFKNIGSNELGLGLGLSVSRRSVEASKGTLSVRDIPGSGCVFTISLPRHSMPLS